MSFFYLLAINLPVLYIRAQEIFRKALNADSLHLGVIRAPPPLPEQPPPNDQPLSPIPSDKPLDPSTPVKPEIKTSDKDTHESPSKGPASPPKGPPPPVPARNPNTALSSSRFVATNTRKIGKKIHIQLTKGKQLVHGFSSVMSNLCHRHSYCLCAVLLRP